MPRDDKPVQVLAHGLLTASGAVNQGVPVEMGAQGDLIELIAVHYSVNSLPAANGPWAIALALSSNPSHLLTPPANIGLLVQDPSVYGLFVSIFSVIINGINYANSHEFNTGIIPLYGIVRPRRQILVMSTNTGTAVILKAEIYYRPIHGSRTSMDSVNRKFGLYRRS